MENKKFNKETLISIIAGSGIIGYIIFNTFFVSLAQKDIMYFLQVTLIIPAIFLIVYGIYVGRNKGFMQALPKIILMTAITFIVSCVSMVYIYKEEYIFTMLDNTATSDSIALSINSSVTLGTVVQQILIFLVCGCIGSQLGHKVPLLFKKVKN